MSDVVLKSFDHLPSGHSPQLSTVMKQATWPIRGVSAGLLSCESPK